MRTRLYYYERALQPVSNPDRHRKNKLRRAGIRYILSSLERKDYFSLRTHQRPGCKYNNCPAFISSARGSKKDINLYINSPGGSVSSALAIYDTMQFVKPDVATICVGFAASAAAVLLASGVKGKRSALPNSEIMIH